MTDIEYISEYLASLEEIKSLLDRANELGVKITDINKLDYDYSKSCIEILSDCIRKALNPISARIVNVEIVSEEKESFLEDCMMRQVVSDCEELNNSILKGTGMVCVPKTDIDVFKSLEHKYKSLSEDFNNLDSTLRAVLEKRSVIDLGNLVERSSLITGQKSIAIPGINAPRLGDEHLDRDYIYSKYNK